MKKVAPWALSVLLATCCFASAVAYADDEAPSEQEAIVVYDAPAEEQEAFSEEIVSSEDEEEALVESDGTVSDEETIPAQEEAAEEEPAAVVEERVTPEEKVASVEDNGSAVLMFSPSGDSFAGHEADSWRFRNGYPIELSEDVDESGLSAQAEFKMWTKNSKGEYISSNGKVITGAKRRGVDVSEWNGHIDWAKAKADDVSFAILRVGGTFYGSKKQYEDSEFLYNAKECERLGIPYGVYFFSAAENVYQAWQEANYTIQMLKGRKVTLPVYYDLEWEGVASTSNRTMLANISKVFCNAVKAAGFKPGVYASLSWWSYYLTDSCFNNWDRWVAQYYSRCEYEGSYRLWQCSSTAKVNGIGGSGVDLNFDFTTGSQDKAVTGSGNNPLQGMICPNPPSALKASDGSPTVAYRAHVQNVGWQGTKTNGATAGTSGQSLRVEALQIDVGGVSGGVTYRTHVQNVGWLPWMSNGMASGTSDMSYRVEALEIKLTGDVAKSYDIWYRAHVQNVGWQNWVKNGATAGTSGKSLRVEAIEILLLPKGQVPSSGGATVTYDAHVQNIGWMDSVANGMVAGTSGRSLRVEAMHLSLSGVAGGITYRTHVQNIGWQGWKSNGALTGTTGQSLRLEAIEIKLTGDAANKYDVWYRAHIQNIGWQGWVKNGAMAGTSGLSLRMEAVQVAVTPKGSGAPVA